MNKKECIVIEITDSEYDLSRGKGYAKVINIEAIQPPEGFLFGPYLKYTVGKEKEILQGEYKGYYFIHWTDIGLDIKPLCECN